MAKTILSIRDTDMDKGKESRQYLFNERHLVIVVRFKASTNLAR